MEWIEPLPPGHAGTLRTLQVMRWLCRRDYQTPFVSEVVSSLLSSSNSIDHRQLLSGSETAQTLFLFARDEIRFEEDRGPNGETDIERVADFQRTTELGWGDCDDKCIWLATSLLSQNIACRFRVQSYLGETWDHVYCDYWDWSKFRWIALDPTADGHTGIVAEVGWRQPLPATGREMIYPV